MIRCQFSLTRLAAGLASLCLLAASAAAEPITLKVEPVPLDPENPAVTRVGQLQYLGGLWLRSADRAFGGLSGLTLADDGRRLIAVSDRADWFTADILRADDGRLRGLANADLAPMRGRDGGRIAGGNAMRDAEAVERLPDGGLIVGFERRHRLWRYGPGPIPALTTPLPVKAPKALRFAPNNGGLEAIAAFANGELLIVAEDYRATNGDFVGWLWRDDAWHDIRYMATGQFKPTDFAVLPDGDVVALERRFTAVGGVAGRVQRIAADMIEPGARLVGTELARLERSLSVDNFEGIAAHRDPDGATLIYILSDDNFNRLLQRTLLLLFALDETG